MLLLLKHATMVLLAASVLTVVALSSFQPTDALRSMQPLSVVPRGVASVLPLCGSVTPGSLHIGKILAHRMATVVP